MTLGGNLSRLDEFVANWWRLPSRGVLLTMASAKVAATVADTAVENTAVIANSTAVTTANTVGTAVAADSAVATDAAVGTITVMISLKCLLLLELLRIILRLSRLLL